MTEQVEKSLLNKIKKLLNMTEARGATPEEAATAAGKAQELLFAHNLSMSQVEAHNVDAPKEKMEKAVHNVDGPKVSHNWKRHMWHRVARYNFCAVITEGASKTGLYVIGKPSNVEVFVYMARTIGDQIHAMGQASLREMTYGQRAFYQSFCVGAVATVVDRLAATQRAQAAATSSCTALVVQSQGEVQKAVEGFFPRLRMGRAIKSGRPDGYEAGRAAGHKVSLNRAVGAAAQRRRLA